MTSAVDPLQRYRESAADLCERFESVAADEVHAAWLNRLPMRGGLALDVGAGSGRDAAALADRGFEVLAVEPVEAMRAQARRRHAGYDIRWLDDRLPELARVSALGSTFDLILLSAVWMHLPPEQRPVALARLASLLKPGGWLVVSLRLGPADPAQGVYAVSTQELQESASAQGMQIVIDSGPQPDRLQRPDIQWRTLVLDRDRIPSQLEPDGS